MKTQLVEFRDYQNEMPPPFYLPPHPDIWTKGGQTVIGGINRNDQTMPILRPSYGGGSVFMRDMGTSAQTVKGANIYNNNGYLAWSKHQPAKSNVTPEGMNLGAAYPSPYSLLSGGTFSVPFTLSHSSVLSIAVYDLLGKEVYRINAGEYAAGNQRLTIPASDMQRYFASGVYFLRMYSPAATMSTQFLITR